MAEQTKPNNDRLEDDNHTLDSHSCSSACRKPYEAPRVVEDTPLTTISLFCNPVTKGSNSKS